ncbi:MAG: 50S ribosomal protein L18 [Candidatus Latescibacteria bacterium]|nr:50S ribosomal protein L18 [Candidatus Latescibacterota bacterium]
MQERLKNLRRRHLRIRKRVLGTIERPRLSVNRSLKHIRAQLIDDMSGRSILGVSSLSPDLREQLTTLSGKCEKSRVVGRFLAQKALDMGVLRVVFDRGGYLYHGRVKALAEGAREGGLQF